MKETSVEVQVPSPMPHPTVPTGVTATKDDTPVIVGGYTIGGSPVTLHQTKDKRVIVELQLLQGDKGAGKRGRKGTPRQPCAEYNLKLGLYKKSQFQVVRQTHSFVFVSERPNGTKVVLNTLNIS